MKKSKKNADNGQNLHLKKYFIIFRDIEIVYMNHHI